MPTTHPEERAEVEGVAHADDGVLWPLQSPLRERVHALNPRVAQRLRARVELRVERYVPACGHNEVPSSWQRFWGSPEQSIFRNLKAVRYTNR